MNRKQKKHPMAASALILGLALACGAAAGLSAAAEADAEKAKAEANPYANDLGPKELSAEDAGALPAGIKEGYQLMMSKCASCHSSARPLNSQFLEPQGDEAAQAAKIEELKKSNPELFKEKIVSQVEAGIWKRYVKRMMAKPGCNISPDEGKKIYQFMVHDSAQRKLKNPGAWISHRKKLLEDFKKKNPDHYKRLYEAK